MKDMSSNCPEADEIIEKHYNSSIICINLYPEIKDGQEVLYNEIVAKEESSIVYFSCELKKIIKEKKDLAIMILVDRSGSMHGCNFLNPTTIGLVEILDKLNIPICVVGFRYCDFKVGEVNHIHYLDWDDDKKRKYSLVDNQYNYANRDDFSIRYATEMLNTRKERNKILIILSDNCPCYVTDLKSRSLCDLEKDKEQAIKEAEDKHIKVFDVDLEFKSGKNNKTFTINNYLSGELPNVFETLTADLIIYIANLYNYKGIIPQSINNNYPDAPKLYDRYCGEIITCKDVFAEEQQINNLYEYSIKSILNKKAYSEIKMNIINEINKFSRSIHNIISDKPNPAIMILIDASYSDSDIRKKIAVFLIESLYINSIQTAAIGYNMFKNRNNVISINHYHYLDWNDRKNIYNIMDLGENDSEIYGFSIRNALEILNTRKEKNKALIIISPNNKEHKEVIERVINEVEGNQKVINLQILSWRIQSDENLFESIESLLSNFLENLYKE